MLSRTVASHLPFKGQEILWRGLLKNTISKVGMTKMTSHLYLICFRYMYVCVCVYERKDHINHSFDSGYALCDNLSTVNFVQQA